MARLGQRCILLGNPQGEGKGSGDQFDGAAISVSPWVNEYHQIGSRVKDKRKDVHGIWVHVYRRVGQYRTTFKYFGSHIDWEEEGERKIFEQRTEDVKKKFGARALDWVKGRIPKF